MRRAVIAAAAAAAVAVPTAQAAPARHVYPFAANDVALVAGTDIGCSIQGGSAAPTVVCLRTDGKGIRANTYTTGLGATKAALAHVAANGKLTKVFERTAQAVTRKAVLQPGDGFTVRGTDIGCVVSNSPDGNAISCFHFDANGTVVGSYGTMLTPRLAAVTRFSDGITHTLVQRLHGK